MAIRSGGPKKPGGDIPKVQNDTADAVDASKKPRVEASRYDGTSKEPHAPPTARAEKFSGPLVVGLTQELAALEKESLHLLAALSAQGFESTALERWAKEMDRVRRRMDALKKRLLRLRRAQREAASDFNDVPESDLGEVEERLSSLDDYSTDWARALAALELGKDLDKGQTQRRLVLDGDKVAALEHAEGGNLATALADLASVALKLAEGKSVRPGDDATFGGSLAGQVRLEETIAPKLEE